MESFLMDKGSAREKVRENYAKVAGSCCDSGSGCCCGGTRSKASFREMAFKLGYGPEEVLNLPADLDFVLGCGNPLAVAFLKAGETVLDLGSGAGFDCFIAAEKVGPEGRVIGVDMTPEMVERARSSIEERTNVEFRLGEIEHLPVADGIIDAIMSNCVVNLSPEKGQVFREAFRVLRPGGRLALSDVVRTRSFEGTKWEGDSHLSQCISGSASVQELKEMLAGAGFEDIRIVLDEGSREFMKEWDPGSGVENYICSALIEAVRPGA